MNSPLSSIHSMLKSLKTFWIYRFFKKYCFYIITYPRLLRIPLYGVTNRYKEILYSVFQRELPLPSFSDTRIQRNGTAYLFYYEGFRAGIDHLKYNLKFYLLEAGKLNRTCVITNLNLHKFHNNDIEVSKLWTKYIEFEKSIFPKEIDYIFYREFLRKEFSKNEVLVVQRNYNISLEENKKYRVIIRDVQNYPGMYAHLRLVSELQVLFYPAKRIMDEVKRVLQQIPAEFCAVSIRRTDMLNNYDSLSEQVSSQSVMKKIQEYNPQKLPVFMMTDEPNRNYYNNLSNDFEVYRYYDFENLVKVAAERDNYFLYELEKLIFLEAKIQIHTFKNAWVKYSLSDIKRSSNRWKEYLPSGLFDR